MMQGYDAEAAVAYIAGRMRRDGHRLAPGELEAFIRRAIDADMHYMEETDVIDADGLMGDGEYDDDDAFEALLDELSGGMDDEGEIDRLAQMLDSYMGAQQDFLNKSGLMQAD